MYKLFTNFIRLYKKTEFTTFFFNVENVRTRAFNSVFYKFVHI